MALGFQQAGFKVTHGIELMENATLNANYNLSLKRKEKARHICGDITQMDGAMFKDAIGPNGCIVIGGPPCQAYSMIGRAKLNSIRSAGCYLDDKRGHLFEDFLRFALELDARAVVMENVPMCTAYGEINVPEVVASMLEKRGYTVYWSILNAADYGVPQVRERMILIAVKGAIEPVMPKPTHSGKNFSDVYLSKAAGDCEQYEHFMKPRQKSGAYPKWVTVEDAISDLPELQETGKAPYKANSMNLGLPYESEPENDYQALMRKKSGKLVTANCYRNTPRDFPIFARMKCGDKYIQAADIAEELFSEECRAKGIRKGTLEYDMLREKMVPPYSREKFISKWQKLFRNKPSHTLVAHLSVDTYSHIHPWEPRGISVREAARLQSFPDDYVFNSTIGDAYKQIGNAVPPLLAKGVAKAVKKALEEQVENDK